MATEFPEAVHIFFADCRAVSRDDFVADAVTRLMSFGARFVRPMSLDPLPDPHSLGRGKGWAYSDIRHPKLLPGALAHIDIERNGPGATAMPSAFFAAFPNEGQAISITQTSTFEDESRVDALAHGQLRLALEMYPLFRPRLGHVDEAAFGHPPTSAMLAGPPPALYWANFFGPEVVALLGRNFLAAAPGWRLVDLDDGGALYVATESYMAWWRDEHDEILEYFRRRAPEIVIYRGEPIP